MTATVDPPSLAMVAYVEGASFMYAPIVRTIMRGLLASGAATEAVATPVDFNANHSAWRPRLKPTDIFVWLGDTSGILHPIAILLGRLTERGVFTVLYNAEELDRPWFDHDHGGSFFACLRLLSTAVTQVWDFSMGNVAHCQAWRKRQPKLQL